ncbi:hypothetical protein KAS41_00090 [Candidatus Parcubacteria bacterium]|nr:hypothetical protein [Candidatus Parcubacteria bacterium]
MRYLKNNCRLLKHIIVIPLLSALAIPIVISDILVEIYHRICFPLCKIPYVKRKNYIKIDRHKLKYLNWLQKIYCAYCGYANGVIQYWVKIAGETERYWCGIQHEKNPDFAAPPHHKDFAEYNNESDFNKKYKC